MGVRGPCRYDYNNLPAPFGEATLQEEMVPCFLFQLYAVFTCIEVQFHGPPVHISNVKSIMQKEPEE
jgi:hypothetical protein